LKHGEKKKERKPHSSKEQQFNIGLIGRSEENEYTVPDPTRTMINITNELSDIHKKKISQRGNHGRDHWETPRKTIRHD
jgi:hypothetical protein